MTAWFQDTHLLGLVVALGGGLLIGLERERRKGEGDTRRPAGVRTFTLVAASGALAQWLAPGLMLIGAAMVALLSTVSYVKSRSLDPGLTTEVALFVTYLIGVAAVTSPALGGACAVGLAGLLAARTPLHRFATQVLSEQELHAGLLLAGFGLVLLPLIPTEPLPWLGGVSLRPLAMLVWLLLFMQALAHVALRLLGPALGSMAAGFLMGFASSTAAIASMGARARRQPERTGALATSAALSTAATWMLAPLVAASLSPASAGVLLPAALAGLVTALVVGGALALMARREAGAGDDDAQAHAPALSLREAFIVAGGLMLVTLVVTEANRRFGAGGVYLSTALAGLADAHAAVAPLSALFGSHQLSAAQLLLGVGLAIAVNSAVRLVVGFVAGGPRYGWRVAAALLAGNASAWVAGLLQVARGA